MQRGCRGDAEGMSGMTEDLTEGMLDLTEGMLDMSEGMSDLTEGKAGMTEGEDVPDFVGIAGFAVLLVLSCHACPGSSSVIPAWFPSVMSAGSLSDGRLFKRRLRRSPIWWGRALLSFTRRDTRR